MHFSIEQHILNNAYCMKGTNCDPPAQHKDVFFLAPPVPPEDCINARTMQVAQCPNITRSPCGKTRGKPLPSCRRKINRDPCDGRLWSRRRPSPLPVPRWRRALSAVPPPVTVVALRPLKSRRGVLAKELRHSGSACSKDAHFTPLNI